jgi:4-hydroxythreonine-4-phosphate dehydrogenase
MAPRKPVVGISIGDPSGVGPLVLARALAKKAVRAALTPLVFGDAAVLGRFPIFASFQKCGTDAVPKEVSSPLLCEVSQLAQADRRPGKPSLAGGRAQLSYIKALIHAAKAGQVDAMCTAPVSKEQITRAGVPFMGHTELFAEAFGCNVVMLMDGPTLKVALATNHLPLTRVSQELGSQKLISQLELLHRSLRPLLGRAPKIAVCALNPHAGEGGLLGREEAELISPALAEARLRGIACSGPFAADGLFSQRSSARFDVALAMYHDQGLVAVKTTDFERTVNVTLGLPLPRTSPDHGTAYGLVTSGKVSSVPMEAALLKAAELARARGRHRSRRAAS